MCSRKWAYQMANKRTPVDKLHDAIADIVEEYADDIQNNLDVITQKLGPKGALALRQQSRATFEQHTGDYAKGWKYQYRKTRRTSGTTIYNDHYSLPHLLEHSHVIRNGTKRVYGTVPGKAHIAPIADELVSSYEKEVIEKL